MPVNKLSALLAAFVFAPGASGEPLWEAGIGLAALDTPAYRGAEARHNYLLPVPFLVYRGERLRVGRSGVRGLLYTGDRVVVDVSVDGSVPVDGNGDTPRVGMADLAPVIEVGPTLDVGLVDAASRTVRLRLPLRAAVGTDLHRVSHEGWVFHPHVAIDLRRDWNIGVSAGPLFATDVYHAYFYDVTVPDATATRPAFRSGGGFSGTRVTLSASRRLGDLWLGGFVRYDNLRGAVFVDSPLVEREDSVMAGLGISWVLASSSRAGRDVVR